MQLFDARWREPPLDLRISRQRPRSGARSVDQNPVEPAAERQRLTGVERHQTDAERLQGREPARVKIAGNSLNSRFESLGRFVPGRRAEVEKGEARRQIKHRHDRLRAYILNPQSVSV